MLRPATHGAGGGVVALSGGVGGAKLALGLSRVLDPGCLTVVVNTGDDFEHLGFHISPDLDTLTYALAGVDEPSTGWGRREETWSFMSALEQLGGEAWFRLGDRDLAVHVERTRRLRAGEPLSAVAADFARRFGIDSSIVPMSDDPVRTQVVTDLGVLEFQDYFVRRRCAPAVSRVKFDGAEAATPNPAILAALTDPSLQAVVVCPSNPLISIDPILAVPGMVEAIALAGAPVVAVSPIIGGQAVKGPTAKMMAELGLDVSAAAVAEHYGDLIDGYVVDHADASAIVSPGVSVHAAATLMRTLTDREQLAREVLAFADRVASVEQPRRAGEGRA